MLLCKDKNPKMEEIRGYLSVSHAAGFDSLAPHIVNAERDFLIPVIGIELYEQLEIFYNREYPTYENTADQLTRELLELVQSAVVHLAYWIGFDLLNSHVTDGGFRRIESESVKGLYKYQEDRLKNYFRTTGFNRLDSVLQFLETNLDTFEAYSGSEEYTTFKSMFISTTNQFDEIVFIGKSRLTFLRMKGHLQYIEDTEIRKILGDQIYEAIKTEMIKESPELKVTEILPYIRKPLAYLASAMLMEESGADLTEKGLYFSANKSVNLNNTEHSPSSSDRIALLVARNRNYGNCYLDQLRIFLETNRDKWPDAVVTTGKLFRRDNTGKKTFWQ
jgi:hypothetical protein